MITKNFTKNATACRELFFSEDLPQPELKKYQALLRDNVSPVSVIDVSILKISTQLFLPCQNCVLQSQHGLQACRPRIATCMPDE